MAQNVRFYADIMAFHPGVTGSNLLVTVNYPNEEKEYFLVDCGLFQGEEQYIHLNEKLQFDPTKLLFVLVTHNHTDHTGRLPFLVRKGFRKKIYLTKGTSLLIDSALEDSAKILRIDSKVLKNTKNPIYDFDDVKCTLPLLNGVDFNQTIQVNEHIKVTFFMNGHLFGAAMILVQISYEGEDDINILFTGDYNNKNMFFDVKSLPKWIRDLPLNIVIESTYGNTKSTDVKKVFKENTLNVINANKIEVVPVFSLGRAQEALCEIKEWQEEGCLPKDVPVYLAGKLSNTYTNIILNNEKVFYIKDELKNFIPENFNYVSGDKLKDLILDKNRKIILTTSGMGTNGPAAVLLPEYVKNSNAVIHFMGYLEEHSRGYKIMNTPEGECIDFNGKMIPKYAKVYSTSEYSAHAKSDELIQLLNQFNNKRMVLINHGRIDIQEEFKKKVVQETDARDVGVFGGKYAYRINHWGYVKTLPLKLNIN